MDHNTRNIVEDLHAMMTARLFGNRPWLADREACEALRRRLDELGLQEPVGEEQTRSTKLGKELDLEIVMVFIGLWHEVEMIGILEDRGLIDEASAYILYELIDIKDPEQVLRPVVQKASVDHYNPSRLLA